MRNKENIMKDEVTAINDNSSNTELDFSIQRIYTKDISFEAPNVPEIFQSEWTPDVNLTLNTNSRAVFKDIHEVILHLTVTVKLQDKIAFLIEVQQAGIFTIKGFVEKQLDQVLRSFCPNILFPYARELVSETICRGSFPPLYLAPINFDTLYQEQRENLESNGSVRYDG